MTNLTACEECDDKASFLEYFVKLQSYTGDGKQKFRSALLGFLISPQKMAERGATLLKPGKGSS